MTVNRYKLHPLAPSTFRPPRLASAPLLQLVIVVTETTLDGVVAAEVMVAFDVEDDTIDELEVAETADDSFDVLGVLEIVDEATEVLIILDEAVVEPGIEEA